MNMRGQVKPRAEENASDEAGHARSFSIVEAPADYEPRGNHHDAERGDQGSLRARPTELRFESRQEDAVGVERAQGHVHEHAADDRKPSLRRNRRGSIGNVGYVGGRHKTLPGPIGDGTRMI